MHPFNLKDFLAYFEEVAEEKYRGALSFSSLEKLMAPVRQGKQEFSLEHIKKVKEDFRFSDWWRPPEVTEKELDTLKGKFVDLKQNNKEVISLLFDIFKNIEIVSVFLRLIQPRYYGILSAPVENILNVRGASQISRYLNYLDNLGKLKEEYGFERIADVDMALWTLATIVSDSKLRYKYWEIAESYLAEINPVKKMAIRNALLEVESEEYDYLRMAELYLETEPEIAGFLAGKELELLVKNLCDKSGVKIFQITNRKQYRRIPELLNDLRNRKALSINDCAQLNKFWQSIRNEIVHEERRFLDNEEKQELKRQIQDMINSLKQIKQKSSIERKNFG